ncbi:dienelactone hydrolase family protein [Corticibacter populi]|uniref:Dienelactone hydrolase family protein n=1 Tax=Corticibacter populi TaxID=1550736 RepID=A0A3M6QZQ7_9BURK|nr:dienelactone hydrolase family protein [Corticibacter populi]RMX08099.1 dienelactone hydrolase family protein [Corticibacter populi]RZS35348.1 carboxymethylenebutenolidase [Corticibacter populi]
MSGFQELQSADGFRFPAYVAQPKGAPKAALVVLQEIFGVNSHIRSVADRLAAEGFLVVAPSTFARVKSGVELGYTEQDMQDGFAIKTAVDALPAPGVLRDIQAAIDFAAGAQPGKVGITGFCWGGLLTWRAAAELKGLSAAVTYYGGGMTGEEEIARQPQVPVLAHFGDKDHWISLESVEAFRKAHPDVIVHVYEADHGFNCDQRGSYDEAAAKLAWGRTLDFFTQHLVG